MQVQRDGMAEQRRRVQLCNPKAKTVLAHHQCMLNVAVGSHSQFRQFYDVKLVLGRANSVKLLFPSNHWHHQKMLSSVSNAILSSTNYPHSMSVATLDEAISQMISSS